MDKFYISGRGDAVAHSLNDFIEVVVCAWCVVCVVIGIWVAKHLAQVIVSACVFCLGML